MKNIFVGNLSFNTNEDELRTLFEPFGQVDRAQLTSMKHGPRPSALAAEAAVVVAATAEIVAAGAAAVAGATAISQNFPSKSD